jgi:opacity protein-like surface antigen
MDKVTWKDYQSLPATAAPKRKDVTNQVSAGVEWTPLRRLTVNVGYQVENRGSSDRNYKYLNHGITAGAAYKF